MAGTAIKGAPRGPVISTKIPAAARRDSTTSAARKMAQRPWRTSLAPALIRSSNRDVIDPRAIRPADMIAFWYALEIAAD
jgi:hypothetical protein